MVASTKQSIQSYHIPQNPLIPIIPMKKLSDQTHHHHHHGEDKNKNNTTPSPLSSTAPNLSVSKPLKRKSRAPNRTATTILTASASNFRALVQQFTGCPTIPMSLGLPIKGPITLNFQKGRRESQVYNYVQYDDTAENPRSPPPCYYYDYQEQQQQEEQQQQQQQRKEPLLQEKQTCGGFCDDSSNNNDNNNYNTNDHWPTSSSSGVSSSDYGMEVSDDQVGFDDLLDDFDFSNLHDLIAMNNMLLSNDIGYFM